MAVKCPYSRLSDMNNLFARIALAVVAAGAFLTAVGAEAPCVDIRINPDSVLADVSRAPVGINVNYFMDGGRFPENETRLAPALRELGAAFLRYPGGEKSDLYMFAPPPYDHSEPTVARTAGLKDYPGMFNPDGSTVFDPLDSDEYIALCRSVGAEPVVVVAADRYLMPVADGERGADRGALIEHAAQWVRYANITRNYGVKYWMIGNETWNANNPGSTAEIYAADVIDFSRAMKAVDPSILIIANGDSEDCFGTVITRAGEFIDRLTVSNYGVWDFVDGYDTYRHGVPSLVYPTTTALNAIYRYATPSQLERLKLIVAEYGTIDWANLWPGNNDMGHAIVNFDMTGQLRLLPQVEFACFWNTRWIESGRTQHISDHDALDSHCNLTPTGTSLKMWNLRKADKMVDCRAGGETVVFAALSDNNAKLLVYAVNKGAAPAALNLSLPETYHATPHTHHEYFGTSDSDLSPQWNESRLNPDSHLTLRPYSINLIECSLTLDSIER